MGSGTEMRNGVVPGRIGRGVIGPLTQPGLAYDVIDVTNMMVLLS